MGKLALSRELAQQNGLASDRYPRSQEEAQKAEAILLEDFARISLDEQEKMVFDIHGLPTLSNNIDDSGDILDDGKKIQKIKEVEKHLNLIPGEKKAAYEEAFQINPEYVESLFVTFIDVYEGDAELIADQLVQHFENKKTLFCTGEDGHPTDLLGRDILMSDLSAAELHLLETSDVQILPSRDAAGRVVVFNRAPTVRANFDKPVLRFYWYLQQCIRQEPGVTTQGYVSVDFCKGVDLQSFDLEYVENITNHIYDGSGIKFVVDHFCYDSNDDAVDAWMKGVALFMDEKYRHRLRFHKGSTAEIMFELQTYGIPTDEFPVTITRAENDDEIFTMKYGWHRQWLQGIRQREHDSTFATSKNATIIPRKFDVLFGRGRDTRVHAGNLRAKQLVDLRFEEYEKANKAGKTAIAQDIVDTILASHGRFLTRGGAECSDTNGDDSQSNSDASSKMQEGWVEVDAATARYKIAHFFRRRRNNGSDNKNKRPSGSD